MHNTKTKFAQETETNKKAVLSQGEPRDAAVNFDTYRSLQRHRGVFTAIKLAKMTASLKLNITAILQNKQPTDEFCVSSRGKNR